MSLRQFVRYCIEQGFDPEIYTQPYPHPHLIRWLESKRQVSFVGSGSMYPDPTKNWDDQDAETMIAFEVLDELQAVQQRLEEGRQKAREQAATLMQQMYPQ